MELGASDGVLINYKKLLPRLSHCHLYQLHIHVEEFFLYFLIINCCKLTRNDKTVDSYMYEATEAIYMYVRQWS